MSDTPDDAAVTALIKRLRGVDPEGRSYAHVMTPLTHSLIREAADALERLAADLAALRRRLDALVQDPAVEDRETQWVMLRAELAEARAAAAKFAECHAEHLRCVAERDAARARNDKCQEDLRWSLGNGATAFEALANMQDERDAARAEWQRLHDLAAQYRAERDALRADLAAARAEVERLRLVYTLANKAVLVYLNKSIEARAERDALRAQVAAVRALCEDPRPPESVHVPADMILAALDSAGQTEGEQR